MWITAPYYEMDTYLGLILAYIVLLLHGTYSQFQFKDDYQLQKRYDSDYPDIIDYDDTRSINHLDGFTINEQFARGDDGDADDGYYISEDTARPKHIKDQPLKKINSRLRNAQAYRDSVAFLSKNKRYANLDLSDESVVGVRPKINHGALKKEVLNSKDTKYNYKNSPLKNRNQVKKEVKKGTENDAKELDHKKAVEKLSLSVKELQNDVSSSSTKVFASSSVKRMSSSQAVSTGVPQPKTVSSRKDNRDLDDAFFAVVVAACSVAGVVGLALAGYCWYRLRKESKDTTESEIVGFSGNTGEKLKANYGGNNGDEKLTKSAEMYHYLHAKKHLTAMDANGKDGSQKRLHIHDASDTSDDESDNTVYECPGLAPPGDMKVVNPLFSDAESRHSDRHSDHHSDAKSEGSGSSSPPYRVGRASLSSATPRP